MTLTERFTGTNDTYAGKVAYRYCLSCDSVLSERIEYSPTVSTTITSWKLYEYDGLNLLRMDERYDNTAGGAISDQDPWRTLEVSTHKPGSLGALIGKRVYTHTNNDATPDATNDYTYTYDAVGNVLAVYNANVTNRGNELYYFTQDAFGNELAPSIFAGSSWSTARPAGITEHQSGKWIDPFTGLYFFHARFYDSTVGRFVGRDPESRSRIVTRRGLGCSMCGTQDLTSVPIMVRPLQHEIEPYIFAKNSPAIFVDPDGLVPWFAICEWGLCFATHGAWLSGCASGCGTDYECVVNCWWESIQAHPYQASAGAAACLLAFGNVSLDWGHGPWHVHYGPPDWRWKMFMKWGIENLFHGKYHWWVTFE